MILQGLGLFLQGLEQGLGQGLEHGLGQGLGQGPAQGPGQGHGQGLRGHNNIFTVNFHTRNSGIANIPHCIQLTGIVYIHTIQSIDLVFKDIYYVIKTLYQQLNT